MIKETRVLQIAVILLAGIIITLVVASLVTEQFRATQSTTRTLGNGVNETFNVSSSTTSTTSIPNCITSTLIFTNFTGYQIIDNNNFTITAGDYDSPCTFVLKAVGTTGWNNTKVNASYDYTSPATNSYVYNITTQGLNTYQNITQQTPLLGTVLILIVIISIALLMFAFVGRKNKNNF